MARAALWDICLATVRRWGEGWTAWRPMRGVPAPAPLPPKLQLEFVPSESIEPMIEGGFRWGRYTTGSEITSKAEAQKIINDMWAEDRQIRIDLLPEVDRWRAGRELPQQGEARTLQHAQCARTFNGRLFEVRKGQWRFQEEGTGICATVQMPADGVPNRSYFAQRNLALIREMIAEHDKARRAARGRARAAARVAEVPTTAGYDGEGQDDL